MKNGLGYARPTSSQEQLLAAALLVGDDAISAWQEWKAGNDLNRIDHSSYRLLPLVYRNLLNHGVRDPLQPKLKGIYRHTWYRNQLLFRDQTTVVTVLREAGIRGLLLKGAALTPGYYGDYGVRPMHDLDIAVPWRDAEKAVQALSASGWRVSSLLPFRGDVPIGHAISFERKEHASIDLHFHMTKVFFSRDVNQSLWDAATTLPGSGVSTLNPADELLLICVHGPEFIIGGHRCQEVQWVADMVTLLRGKNVKIDWDRFVNLARTCRVRPMVSSSLDYVANRFGVPVPPEVMLALDAETVGWEERTFSRLNRRPFSQRSLRLQLFQFRRRTCELSPWQRLVAVPHVLSLLHGRELGWRWPLSAARDVAHWATKWKFRQ